MVWLVVDPNADTDTTPDGLLIALTVVQDALLVGSAVYVVAAMLKRVTPWMFGLRLVSHRDGAEVDARGLRRATGRSTSCC